MPSIKKINSNLKKSNRIIYNSWKSGTTKDIRILGTYYYDSYKQVDRILADMYKKFGDNVSNADMMKYNRLTKVHAQLEEILKDLGIINQKIMTGNIYTTFDETFYKKTYTYDSILTKSINFGLLTKETIDASINQSLGLVNWKLHLKELNQKSIMQANTAIKASLSNGLIQGHGYAKTARSIKDNFNSSFKQIQRVIWTESNRSRSISSLEAFNNLPDDTMEKFWISTLDTKTRPHHQSMDSKFADKEGLFHLPDGTICDAPGLSGVAKHDIHCRCDFGVAIDGELPDKRRDQLNDENISFTNYDDWYKEKVKSKK